MIGSEPTVPVSLLQVTPEAEIELEIEETENPIELIDPAASAKAVVKKSSAVIEKATNLRGLITMFLLLLNPLSGFAATISICVNECIKPSAMQFLIQIVPVINVIFRV